MNVSRASITRISHYRRVIFKLKSLGFQRVFSDNLGDALGISSVQVRKDFSEFGLTGNKKGGYQINEIIVDLDRILGKDMLRKVVVVGCGRMGKTLMSYSGFSGEGIKVVAGFDADPANIDPEGRIPIMDVLEMPDYIRKEKIQIAILTVPEHAAPTALEQLKNMGIKGILNFAPVQADSNPNCEIRNINIALELENMFYFVNAPE